MSTAPDAPFIPVGQIDLPGLPELEPPRYTDLDQSHNPDKAMTRLVKDVLRVGTWHVTLDDGSSEPWDVTEETLRELARNFAARKQAGNDINFIWGHSDDNRDAITPIDQLIVGGDRLWAVGYFTPDVARQLSNPAHKVSIRSVSDWEDGDGKLYPGETLLHVALVETPVVSGQQPFLELSRVRAKSARRFLLTGKHTKDLAMDFEALKTLLNQLFDVVAPQLKIPDHVTDETTFSQWVRDAVSFVDPDGDSADVGEGGEGPPATPEETVPQGEAAMRQMSKIIKSAIAPLAKDLAVVRGELRELKAEKSNARKDAFESRLKDLGHAGLSGENVKHFRDLGAKYGWDPALLRGAETLKGVDMSRVAKGHRDASAPAINGNGRLSDDEIARELEKRGRDPKKMPAAISR